MLLAKTKRRDCHGSKAASQRRERRKCFWQRRRGEVAAAAKLPRKDERGGNAPRKDEGEEPLAKIGGKSHSQRQRMKTHGNDKRGSAPRKDGGGVNNHQPSTRALRLHRNPLL